MSRGGRNGFGGRGGGRGRSRFVFETFSRVKIFLSPPSHEICAGAGRGAQGGEGARQGGGAGAGVAAGGGVLPIGLNFLDLTIIILVIKRGTLPVDVSFPDFVKATLLL